MSNKVHHDRAKKRGAYVPSTSIFTFQNNFHNLSNFTSVIECFEVIFPITLIEPLRKDWGKKKKITLFCLS